ncbi:hypothetical protein VTJ83DRAFT_5026 [Remersonia thermophila]|uniref:Uncharacterized protein n=1 Tax=Remersonia thermophila TaxID=72144 RepID=A0ABR4DDP4_9PEZI
MFPSSYWRHLAAPLQGGDFFPFPLRLGSRVLGGHVPGPSRACSAWSFFFLFHALRWVAMKHERSLRPTRRFPGLKHSLALILRVTSPSQGHANTCRHALLQYMFVWASRGHATGRTQSRPS